LRVGGKGGVPYKTSAGLGTERGHGKGRGQRREKDERGAGERSRMRVFLFEAARLWRVWKSRSMWRTATEEVIEARRYGRSVHKAHRVCTGDLSQRVEEVGKRGWVRRGCGEISICPETHSRLLESSPLFNSLLANRLGGNPLFLRQLRRLLSLILLSFTSV
jgi:hypothetical protein